VAVKQSMGETGAICRPLCETTQSIRQAAATVAKESPSVAAYRVDGPARLEVRLREGPYAEALRTRHGGQMDDRDILALQEPRAIDVWAEYWRIKLDCQQAIRGPR